MSWTPTERDPQELLQDYRRERTELMRQLTEARDLEGYLRKTITSNNDQIKRLRRALQRCREPEPIEVHEPRTQHIDADREMLTAEESARVSDRYRIVSQLMGHWLTFAEPRVKLWADMPWSPLKPNEQQPDPAGPDPASVQRWEIVRKDPDMPWPA